MRFTIIITDEARSDLAAIMDYIVLDAPKRAESHVDELLDKIRTLKHMPKRCPVAPENGTRGYELRHLVYGSYRILFTIRQDQVHILRIIHGARLLDPEIC